MGIYNERRTTVRSAFASVHPIVAFLYYVGAIILCMTMLQPIFLLSAVLLLFCLNLAHGNEKSLKGLLRASLTLALFIAILNPLLTHRGSTMLFYLFDNPVTLEAIVYGIIMALSFFAIALSFSSYQTIISSHKFLYVFSRFSPKIALLTMIAIRFVPLFIRRLTQIQLVQKTKGIQTENGSLKSRASSGMKLLSVLLVCSLEEALQTADSMQARGFGTKKRSTYIRYRFEYRDWIIALALLVCFISCMIAISNGQGVLMVYPRLHNMFQIDWLAYASFLLYISVPLLVEGREWVWWHTHN